MMEKRRRGQIFSADFLVGVIVVLFVMTSLQVYHSRIMEDIRQEEKLVFQESLASRTDTLILFRGEPKNWDNETVKTLGFSTGVPNELNETKLIEYFQMEDEKSESLLGFYERDFYLSIENKTGDVVEIDGIELKRGNKNWQDAENIYAVERDISLYGTSKGSIMRLVVW